MFACELCPRTVHVHKSFYSWETGILCEGRLYKLYLRNQRPAVVSAQFRSWLYFDEFLTTPRHNFALVAMCSGCSSRDNSERQLVRRAKEIVQEIKEKLVESDRTYQKLGKMYEAAAQMENRCRHLLIQKYPYLREHFPVTRTFLLRERVAA